MDDEILARELAIVLFARPPAEPVILREVGGKSRVTYRVIGSQTEAGEWRLIIQKKEGKPDA